jgi:putative ABC transport system permease protein
MLRKNPGATCVMVLSLALAIGANTAIFSVVYGVLLRPLPYADPERIVVVSEVNDDGRAMHFSDPNFDDFSAQNHSLEAMAQYSAWEQPVSGGSQPTRATAAEVSRDFFNIMRVSPVVGRDFSAAERQLNGPMVALVSYAYWQQYLGSNTDLTNAKVKIDNDVFTVVGVMPPGFRFPGDTSIWIPREHDEKLPSRTAHNWAVLARLRDGVSLEQARADISGIAKRIKAQYGADENMVDGSVVPLQEKMVGEARLALLLLLGAVGFLLLVACANVANLLLAQATARESELAIRAALGAGRGRLVRQFLTEALVLSLIGGGVGVFAAEWAVSALVALAPVSIPRVDDIAISIPVLLFALGVCAAVAAGLGILTAVRATSTAPREMLGGSSRGQASSLSSRRIGRVLVAAQLAITLVLLIGAGLLGRSLLRVLSVDSGFHSENVVSIDVYLPFVSKDADKMHRVQFFNDLLTRLQAVPGVETVGVANGLPIGDMFADGTLIAMQPGDTVNNMGDYEKMFRDPTRTVDADYAVASEGYFQALGIPLIRGRLFDDRDGFNAPQVAVISESLAHARWPKEDPIGKNIEFGNMDGDMKLLTIVGVVGDVHDRSLELPPEPFVYVNYQQRPQKGPDFFIVARTNANPAVVFNAARAILHELAPDVPPVFSTVAAAVSSTLDSRRFNLMLIGVFAGTALLLAIAGIYGVMAYSVARRTREIGVRMALGAQPKNVLGLILDQGMITAAIGVGAGILGALALTRVMRSLLFNVSTTDPITFAAVALLLTFVTLLASYLPARRATQVDPIVALREE